MKKRPLVVIMYIIIPPPFTPTPTHTYTHIKFSVRRMKTEPAATLNHKTSEHTGYHYASESDGDLQPTPNIAYHSVEHQESNYELVYEQSL